MASIPDEVRIRLQRAAFNRALAERDTPAIAALLAREAVLVTGTDSAVLAGRKAQLQAWQREFAAPPAQRQLYVRTPDEVAVSAVARVALEHGEWACTVGGAVTASGRYSAHWRQIAGDWVIVAELYVTLG